MTAGMARGTALVLGLSVGVLGAGCSGRTVTSSVQDQSQVLTTQAVSQPAGPGEAQEAQRFSQPGALEEVRVIEPAAPPLVAAPAQTEAAPAATDRLAGLADVFFDYDRAALRPDSRAVLATDATLLHAEGRRTLLISGHCDERGTQTYNLVLGERRAQAAQRYLTDLGVPATQIEIISFGKEQPFCRAHSQACWQQNRRAHLQAQ